MIARSSAKQCTDSQGGPSCIADKHAFYVFFQIFFWFARGFAVNKQYMSKNVRSLWNSFDISWLLFGVQRQNDWCDHRGNGVLHGASTVATAQNGDFVQVPAGSATWSSQVSTLL